MENYVELAKQGDVSAIAHLINRNLQPKGIGVSKVEIASDKLLIELIDLQANELIEDTILQHVRNGAAKLNIATVKQVEVLQKQKSKPSQTIVEPQKPAAIHAQLHSLEDVLQEIKKPEYRIPLVVMAGGVLGVLFLISHPFPDVRGSTISTTSTSAVQPARGGCQVAAGNIWSGVTLYSDSGCNNAVGTISGASSDAQTIKVLAGGESESQPRDVIKGFYVKGDDPAIARMQLLTVD